MRRNTSIEATTHSFAEVFEPISGFPSPIAPSATPTATAMPVPLKAPTPAAS